MDQKEDFVPGDPALRVVGRTEKPARRHRPLPSKPGPTEKAIIADIRLRMQQLEPAVVEYRKLKEFSVKFDAILRELRA